MRLAPLAFVAIIVAGACASASASAFEPPRPARDALTQQIFNGKVKVSRKAGSNAAMKRVFGRALADHELAGLVGAPDGAKIIVKTAPAEERWKESQKGYGFFVETRHPFLVGAQKHTFSGTPGNTRGRLDGIIIDPGGSDGRAAPRGLGARMLAHQVEMSRKLGLRAIYLTASRDAEEKVPLVGAIVWPKLGFDFRLDRASLLYRMQENPSWRDYWAAHAWTQEMKLDLRADSRGLAVHRDYLRTHDIHVDIDAAYQSSF